MFPALVFVWHDRGILATLATQVLNVAGAVAREKKQTHVRTHAVSKTIFLLG
jgi:ATPase subunit of ABC transporter with duplicated ATPase domains